MLLQKWDKASLFALIMRVDPQLKLIQHEKPKNVRSSYHSLAFRRFEWNNTLLGY